MECKREGLESSFWNSRLWVSFERESGVGGKGRRERVLWCALLLTSSTTNAQHRQFSAEKNRAEQGFSFPKEQDR